MTPEELDMQIAYANGYNAGKASAQKRIAELEKAIEASLNEKESNRILMARIEVLKLTISEIHRQISERYKHYRELGGWGDQLEELGFCLSLFPKGEKYDKG